MRRSPFIALALFLAVEVSAGGSAAASGQPMAAWLGPDGLPPPAIVYDAFGRCLSAPHCPDREQLKRLLERYERNYGQRLAPDRPGVDLPPRRDVPPTPPGHIQPAYRNASQVRPEFQHVGEPLPAQQALPRPRAKGAGPSAAQQAAGDSGKAGKRPVALEQRQAPDPGRPAKSLERPAAAPSAAEKAAAPRAPARTVPPAAKSNLTTAATPRAPVRAPNVAVAPRKTSPAAARVPVRKPEVATSPQRKPNAAPRPPARKQR